MGVPIQDVVPLPHAGVVNTALALGEGFVLRVPKPIEEAIADCRTEAIAAPVAFAAGVRTPRLVAFDDTMSVLDVPYTIYERVAGDNFGLLNSDAGDPLVWSAVYRDIGRDLATLHTRVTRCEDPRGWLDQPGRFSRDEADGLLRRLDDRGFLSRPNLRWLTTVLDRLAPASEAGSTWRRFLHGDLGPANVLVHSGTYAAAIDWGDAGWGDPALDFAYLPLRAVPEALVGYRELAALDGDAEAEARILWDHVCLGLHHLDRPARRGAANWDRPPAARFIELAAAAPSFAQWLY